MGVREGISALLFDFDGTIAQTAEIWSQATRACFAAHGHHLDEGMLSRILVNPWPTVVPALSGPAADAIERDIIDCISEAYLACPPAAGFGEFLEQFADVPKAIVSSSYRERLVTPYLCRHDLDRYFPVVIGSEDTVRLKPDPQPVLLALRLLNACRRGAWLVGDSVTDIEAARSAGIGFIGLGGSASGSDLAADSFQALGTLLVSLMAKHEHRAQ